MAGQDALIQYFHWHVRPDERLWRRLETLAKALAEAGFTALWLPPACKGTGHVEYTKAIPVAREHVERSLEVSRRYVLLLLRLAMLESSERVELWEGTPLRHVDVLTNRPEFMAVCMACAGTGLGARPGCWRPPPCELCEGTGRHGKAGGDATAYGAFLWDKQYTGTPGLGWLQVPSWSPSNCRIVPG